MRTLTRAPSCLSDLVLEEWRARELDADAQARADQHLATCARCAARRDALDQEHADFLAQAPSFEAHAERFVPQAGPLRSVRKLRPVAWASALAAAAAVLLLISQPGLEPPLLQTRTKGAPHLGFFVSRDGRVTRGSSGHTVHPGDRLRFTYSTDRALHLALLDLDTAGATVYFPSAARAQRIAAGSDVALDFSVELDARLGPDRVYAIFCPEAFDVEPVREALERTQTVRVAPGCMTDVITLHKAARP